MPSISYSKKSSLIYLCIVPVLTAAIGFGIGQISYLIYLPLWLLNVCLMGLAAWTLGAHRLSGTSGNKQWIVTALLLISPWILFSMFAGMGPPPVTVATWVATATEQQCRYAILILGGILAYFGTTLLKGQLTEKGEVFYASIGHAAISLAIPLFIINMVFWGFYLTEVFRVFAASGIVKRPDWYVTIKSIFYMIGVVEVALIYLATAAFVVSIKRVGKLNRAASTWYIVFSFLGLVLSLLPPSLPEPLGTAVYLIAVPAIPFIMPYLIGIRLLFEAGAQ